MVMYLLPPGVERQHETYQRPATEAVTQWDVQSLMAPGLSGWNAARGFGAPEWKAGRALTGHRMLQVDNPLEHRFVHSIDPSTRDLRVNPNATNTDADFASKLNRRSAQLHHAPIGSARTAYDARVDRLLMDTGMSVGSFNEWARFHGRKTVTAPTPLGPVTVQGAPPPPQHKVGQMPSASTLDFLKYGHTGSRLQPLPTRYAKR